MAAGLLCIGDASHAMSPIGGFGVNLAIQDAVAAANILADPHDPLGCHGDINVDRGWRRGLPANAAYK